MKLWVDDVRTNPDGYVWCKSVNETIEIIEKNEDNIELIDLDHDAGDFAQDGGDFIRILDWLEFVNKSYPIRLHTMNPVGKQNMMSIIKKNNWTIVN